jgi:hypothetical protein
MTENLIFMLKILRKIHAFLFPVQNSFDQNSQTKENDSAVIIYNLINDEKPFMIARFGANELNIYLNYLSIYKQRKSCIKFIRGEQFEWFWNHSQISLFRDVAGFFPTEEKYLVKFGELMDQDIVELNLLASWMPNESLIKNKLQHVQRVFLRDIEPFWNVMNWCSALEGKRVLVIHPFVNEVADQYLKRNNLFHKTILPDFELITYRPVVSLGQTRTDFGTWFEALDFMKTEINNIDFDIALIGAGAYGFHLAAHVKRLGKKAIHMGGALQLLFGIRGKRWEDPNYGVEEWGLKPGTYLDLMNEHWIRPYKESKPKNPEIVEGACYW